MAEYIEREALMKYADTQPGGLISNKSIQFFQAADVAPVPHGEREIVVGSNGKAHIVCTCRRVSQDLTGVFAYCPNCGAKMDDELNE